MAVGIPISTNDDCSQFLTDSLTTLSIGLQLEAVTARTVEGAVCVEARLIARLRHALVDVNRALIARPSGPALAGVLSALRANPSIFAAANPCKINSISMPRVSISCGDSRLLQPRLAFEIRSQPGQHLYTMFRLDSLLLLPQISLLFTPGLQGLSRPMAAALVPNRNCALLLLLTGCRMVDAVRLSTQTCRLLYGEEVIEFGIC